MFANACEKASKFTRPMIVSYHTAGDRTASGAGAFIIVNRDGWIITAGHIFESFHKYQMDQKKIEEYKKTKEEDPNSMIELDPDVITNHSFWWGDDRLRLSQVYVNTDLDFALAKLDGFQPDTVREYPVFKNPEELRMGTSLCRLGYPFVENMTDFDKEKGMFRIKQGVIPMPQFPNEGILTCNLNAGRTKDGYDKFYLETSSPGLKGQSGGPIFDSKGFVAAMQVRTMHLNLGFAPYTVDSNGNKTVENQFLNVGIGVHVRTIMQILDDKKVKYRRETDDQGFRIMD